MTCRKARRRDAVMLADEMRDVANELEPAEVAAKVERRRTGGDRHRLGERRRAQDEERGDRT